MEKPKLSPETVAVLTEQINIMNSHGIKTNQLIGVVDSIINGNLVDKNYVKSGQPLLKAADKQKEAERILKNYNAALTSLVADKKAGKDDEAKSSLKLIAIFGAAFTGLTVLGYKKDEINAVLGLSGVIM